jgi:hypothetical protein
LVAVPLHVNVVLQSALGPVPPSLMEPWVSQDACIEQVPEDTTVAAIRFG